MYVLRKKDAAGKNIFAHRIADYPGGVAIKTSVLGGSVLEAGTHISAPNASTGLAEVCKSAIMQANATNAAVSLKVEKGHHFIVGDFVTNAVSGAAYAITGINKSNASYDTLTIGTTLGVALSVGDYIYEASEEADGSDTHSALKNIPIGVVGTEIEVQSGVSANVDLWLIAVIRKAQPGAYKLDNVVSI